MKRSPEVAPRCVLVGVNGYGRQYLRLLERHGAEGRCQFVAAVDPTLGPEQRPLQTALGEVPVYDDVESALAAHEAELTIISSPVPFHLPQSLAALAGGTDVLCEKPLVPLWAEADQLQAAVEASGKQLAVGFQWSFSPVMLELKRRIAAGELGQPRYLASLVSWPRYDAYYEGSWHGQLATRSGLALDSIATNACAHHLHILFFLLGEGESGAAMPSAVEAELYRSKEIPSFDSCFLRGRIGEDGPEFRYAVSHSAQPNEAPYLRFEFERATVSLGSHLPVTTLFLEHADGRLEALGDVASEEATGDKLCVCWRSAARPPCPARSHRSGPIWDSAIASSPRCRSTTSRRRPASASAIRTGRWCRICARRWSDCSATGFCRPRRASAGRRRRPPSTSRTATWTAFCAARD